MSKWQAPLNFPFITRFLSLKSTGWLVQIKKHQQSFSSMPTGDRLFQRVRRRLHTMGVAPSIHSCQAQAWRTLYCLTAPGRLSFDTGIFHDWEVYALYRSAGHLEQPTRTHARKLLKKILEFRNLTVPKLNKPLAIPLMAHPTFKESVQRFLRVHIWNHIDLAIPLHLPTHKIREAASPTLGSALFNFRRMETLFDFSNPDSVPCSCFDIWKRLQRSQRPPSPHYERVAIAAALEQFQFPPDLQIFQNANSRSTYFRSRNDVFKNFEERLLLWTRHHGLPPCSVALVSQFLLKHWTLHCQEIQQRTRFTHSDLARLKRWLPRNVVLHHADHEIHRITVFCPRLYSFGVLRTWQDDQLFSVYPGTAPEARPNTNGVFAPILSFRMALYF